MTFLDWDEVMLLAEAHSERYRAMIYLAVDSGMRWSELVGLRRGKLDLRHGKVRVTEQLVQLSDVTFLRKEPKTAAGVRSITISPFTARCLPSTSRLTVRRVLTRWCFRTRRATVVVLELLDASLRQGAEGGQAEVPVP